LRTATGKTAKIPACETQRCLEAKTISAFRIPRSTLEAQPWRRTTVNHEPKLKMKNKIRNLILAGSLILCSLAASSMEAAGLTTPTSFTNATVALAGSSTTTINSTNVCYITRGQGLALFTYLAATNSSTATVINNYDATHDGSSWTTTPFISTTNTLTGTTPVRDCVVIPASRLEGVRAIRWKNSVNAHTSTVFMTNNLASRHN
jgi:hypothetical protein